MVIRFDLVVFGAHDACLFPSWFNEHSTEPAPRYPRSLGARLQIRLEYLETFVRVANLTTVKASVFFVSLRPLSKSHWRRDDQVERRLSGRAPSMRKSSSGHAGQAIERVLELSADAQISIRRTPKDSPEFHSLKGAIAAYGKTLGLLAALQQREEFYAVIALCEVSDGVAA